MLHRFRLGGCAVRLTADCGVLAILATMFSLPPKREVFLKKAPSNLHGRPGGRSRGSGRRSARSRPRERAGAGGEEARANRERVGLVRRRPVHRALDPADQLAADIGDEEAGCRSRASGHIASDGTRRLQTQSGEPVRLLLVHRLVMPTSAARSDMARARHRASASRRSRPARWRRDLDVDLHPGSVGGEHVERHAPSRTR